MQAVAAASLPSLRSASWLSVVSTSLAAATIIAAITAMMVTVRKAILTTKITVVPSAWLLAGLCVCTIARGVSYLHAESSAVRSASAGAWAALRDTAELAGLLLVLATTAITRDEAARRSAQRYTRLGAVFLIGGFAYTIAALFAGGADGSALRLPLPAAAPEGSAAETPLPPSIFAIHSWLWHLNPLHGAVTHILVLAYAVCCGIVARIALQGMRPGLYTSSRATQHVRLPNSTAAGATPLHPSEGTADARTWMGQLKRWPLVLPYALVLLPLGMYQSPELDHWLEGSSSSDQSGTGWRVMTVAGSSSSGLDSDAGVKVYTVWVAWFNRLVLISTLQTAMVLLVPLVLVHLHRKEGKVASEITSAGGVDSEVASTAADAGVSVRIHDELDSVVDDLRAQLVVTRLNLEDSRAGDDLRHKFNHHVTKEVRTRTLT